MVTGLVSFKQKTAYEVRISDWSSDVCSSDLLDGNVALKKIGFVKDASGRRRLARIYNFEFTVTGESRHSGTITQFGAHSAQIELAPYPMPFEESAPTPIEPVQTRPRAEVIELRSEEQSLNSSH